MKYFLTRGRGAGIFLPLTLALLSTLLVGCAGTSKVALKKDAVITSVSVRDATVSAEEIWYAGPGFGFGMMFGLVGALLVTDNSMTEAEILEAFAKEHDINIARIVRDAFVEELQQTRRFPVDDGAETHLVLDIKQYGLSIPHGFSFELVPVLLVQAKLINASGLSLWEGGHHILPLGNPADPVKLDEIKADPALLASIWRKAADEVAAESVKQM